jgi:hypothetical protein
MSNWIKIDKSNLPKEGEEILFNTNYDIVYDGHWHDIIRDNPTEEEELEDIIDGFSPLFYSTNAKAIEWIYYPEPSKQDKRCFNEEKESKQ